MDPAACSAAFVHAGPPAADVRWVRAALKTLFPAGQRKELSALEKLYAGNVSWRGDVSRSQTCNLGDQIPLTVGRHSGCKGRLCSWYRWDISSVVPGLPSKFPSLLVLSEWSSRRFKKGSLFFFPMFLRRVLCLLHPSAAAQPGALLVPVSQKYQENFHDKTPEAAAGWFRAGQVLK